MYGEVEIENTIIEFGFFCAVMQNDFLGILFFSTEVSFAVTFENMLNCYSDPVYKQMAVEFFSVLTKIMKRHPEICFIESLNVDQMLEQAIKLYAEVCKKKEFFQIDFL